MKNWMFVAFTFVFFASSCTKFTTPKKVERILPTDSWTISNFTLDGASIVENYDTYRFSFGENGGISVKSSVGFTSSGSWTTGLDKNPAILYLSFPPDGGLEFLADDWQVVEIQKDLLRLKRNDSGNQNSSITMRR